MTTTISPELMIGSQAPRLTSLPPLSLYIHIPWCMKKCPYCDFNSHEVRTERGDMPEAEYVAALVHDLETAVPQVWGRPVVSVFFGGGTPSLFSAQSIETILSTVRALLPLELSPRLRSKPIRARSKCRSLRISAPRGSTAYPLESRVSIPGILRRWAAYMMATMLSAQSRSL